MQRGYMNKKGLTALIEYLERLQIKIDAELKNKWGTITQATQEAVDVKSASKLNENTSESTTPWEPKGSNQARQRGDTEQKRGCVSNAGRRGIWGCIVESAQRLRRKKCQF